MDDERHSESDTVDAEEVDPRNELSAVQKQRKRRLLALKSQVDQAAPVEEPESLNGAGAEEVNGSAAADGEQDEGAELNDFLKNLVDRRKQRRHQLQIIQDFFENPVAFGIHTDVIPNGTPLGEIEDRKRELQYRIDLLKSVLEAFEGEMSMLKQAEMSALSPGGGSSAKDPKQDVAADDSSQ